LSHNIDNVWKRLRVDTHTGSGLIFAWL